MSIAWIIASDSQNRRSAHHLVYESLEPRCLFAADWQNPFNPFDVDDSGLVTPLDALLLINDLKRNGIRLLPEVAEGTAPPPYLDVNASQSVEPVDALLVINVLLRGNPPPAVTASLAPESDHRRSSCQLCPTHKAGLI